MIEILICYDSNGREGRIDEAYEVTPEQIQEIKKIIEGSK